MAIIQSHQSVDLCMGNIASESGLQLWRVDGMSKGPINRQSLIRILDSGFVQLASITRGDPHAPQSYDLAGLVSKPSPDFKEAFTRGDKIRLYADMAFQVPDVPQDFSQGGFVFRVAKGLPSILPRGERLL